VLRACYLLRVCVLCAVCVVCAVCCVCAVCACSLCAFLVSVVCVCKEGGEGQGVQGAHTPAIAQAACWLRAAHRPCPPAALLQPPPLPKCTARALLWQRLSDTRLTKARILLTRQCRQSLRHCFSAPPPPPAARAIVMTLCSMQLS